MLNTTSIKTGNHKAGKSFVLLFNRVSMYGPNHPFSSQAVDEFYEAIQEYLKITSPAVLIYTRDQFFLEDEPLDRNLNYFKMSSHFKKARVTSISIHKDIQKREVADFVRIFLNTRQYPMAEQMRAAAGARKIENIKINHIFYQKVTQDDQVVAKSETENSNQLKDELESSLQYQDALGMIAGKLLMEELDQNLSLNNLIKDPQGFSHSMVAKSLPECHSPNDGDGPAEKPYSITRHLSALSTEIRDVISGNASVNLSELAEALVKMKRELLNEIEAQKSLGRILDKHDEIRDQAETITDTVILELVRKEYDKGKTSVERLAFVLQRILPITEDLKRLLPKLKECLMSEGMSLPDYATLIKHIAANEKGEELIHAINQVSDDIGVDGNELLERLKSDSPNLIRFLYLATEIERETGSSKPLSDILVGYLERLGSKFAIHGSKTNPASDDDDLRKIIFQFNKQVLNGLRSDSIDSQVVSEVEQRLKSRLEASVQAIRAELAEYKAVLKSEDANNRTLLQTLEDSIPDDHELKRLLQQTQTHFAEHGLDENDFQKILELIDKYKKNGNKIKEIEDIIFNKKQTSRLLELEILRAERYGTDVSVISFSVLKTALPNKDNGNEVSSVDVTTAILRKLRDKLRGADWIGLLSKNLFIAVLPMTTLKEAHITSRRLLKALNADPIILYERSVRFKLSSSVVQYNRKLTADVDAFIRFAENEHTEMTHRLRNLQDFM